MLDVKISGLDGIYDNLDMMVVAVRDRILKTVLRKVGTIIRDAARQACPVDLGILRDSIIVRVASVGPKGNVVGCWVGPQRDIKAPVGRDKTGLGLPPGVAIPTRYAHLIEFGHRLVVNQKVIGLVTPRPFMRTAWDLYGGDNALYTFTDLMVEEVETELAKTFRYKATP